MLFLDLENHGFLANTCIETCHVTIKFPRFSRAIHTKIISFKTLCCVVFRGSNHGKSIIYLVLFLQYSCSSLPQLRFEKLNLLLLNIFYVAIHISFGPRWLSWMRRPTGDQEVAGSTPAEVGNMKYFLWSFSPFR